MINVRIPQVKDLEKIKKEIKEELRKEFYQSFFSNPP